MPTLAIFQLEGQI